MLSSPRSIGVLMLVIALGTATGVARSTEVDRSVTGTWSVTVKGHGAHGDVQAELTLKQEGNAVTGRLSAHGKEHAVEGEFTGSTLRLSTTQRDAHGRLTLTAALEEDGTLAGRLSGPDGDLPWTAERVKGK